MGAHARQLRGLARVNWVHSTLLVGTPLIALYGMFTTALRWQTFCLTVVFYALCGFGITAGYHRMFSHRAYKGPTFTWVLWACFGAASIQGSIRWWCRNHRTHHRYTDTDKDPYSVRKGFFYAHMGWMLEKQNYSRVPRGDIADLESRLIVRLQHRFYPFFALTFGIFLPTAIAHWGWGDARGGFYFASALRIVLVHHATFFVNSLAHYFGNQPFSDYHSAQDSVLTAVLTLGEGYHNFHHEFPNDYRNAVHWWQYDPTKWCIRILYWLGLAYDLKTTNPAQLELARIQMRQFELDKSRSRLQFGRGSDQLPPMLWSEFQALVHQPTRPRYLLVLDGIVYDVENFLTEHPGGRSILLSSLGRDCSDVYNGKEPDSQFHMLHAHSKFALSRLETMRVARLVGDSTNS